MMKYYEKGTHTFITSYVMAYRKSEFSFLNLVCLRSRFIPQTARNAAHLLWISAILWASLTHSERNGNVLDLLIARNIMNSNKTMLFTASRRGWTSNLTTVNNLK